MALDERPNHVTQETRHFRFEMVISQSHLTSNRKYVTYFLKTSFFLVSTESDVVYWR